MNSLDIYSKVEPYLDFYDTYDELHQNYIDIIDKLRPSSLLDVGCGRGFFLDKLQNSGIQTFGIDLSKEMVKLAQEKGHKVSNTNICELNSKYDVITAIGDVVNYIKPSDLGDFFACVKNSLNSGGVFIFDINTLYGFENISQGDWIYEEESKTITIKSTFKNNTFDTSISIFTKDKDGYKKESGFIQQYYHKINQLKKISKMRLVTKQEQFLFSDVTDKIILVFQV